MNLRKIFISLIMIIVLLASILVTQSVFAQTPSTPKYLGITELRKNDDPNFGYGIGEPKTNGNTGTAAKIWNILEYTGEGDNAPEKSDGSKNIYCVKAGQGFSDTKRRAVYNVFYNMKTEREAIKNQNDVLKSIVEGTVPYKETQVSKYDSLLALGDILYLIDESTDSEKTALLEAAGINLEAYSVFLTRDDIAAVQQAAIWYFTNYENDGGKYDKTLDSGWLQYTEDGNNYQVLSNYKNHEGYDGKQRQQQAEKLYKYLIDTAKENANNYSSSSETKAPATVTTTNLNYEEKGNNYIIGPIRIDNVEESNIPYTIDFSVNKDYKLLDNNKSETDKNVKDFVGKDFYISVSDVENLEISINIKYTSNNLTLWASQNDNQAQPVMIPEKTEKSIPTKLTLDVKPFDLALRKYITHVNGVAVKSTRKPNIDESTLKSNTTATYNHRKDPVPVKIGDEVTYNLTVYNEGKIAGRATNITDQLPTGLEYVEDSIQGNYEKESYDATTNKLVLKRTNENNIEAYPGSGEPKSETVTIKCKVTAQATEEKQVLTNVAWISEDANEYGTVPDRDSQPTTSPNVNKNGLLSSDENTYKGDTTNKDVEADDDYYWKGQQDDDDFEKLVVNPSQFDLKLVKYISAINNDTSKGKSVTKIDTTDLAAGTKTTADYTLSKDVVSVKHGDYVTYTFRVYNEGDIDGYVTKLTDNIPLGLQFVQAKEDGETITIYSYSAEEGITSKDEKVDEETYKLIANNNAHWGIDTLEDGNSTLKTDTYDGDTTPSISIDVEDYLNGENKLLKAYDSSKDINKNGAGLDSVDVTLVLKVSKEAQINKIIRNEAAITGDSDEKGDPIKDRDSEPENWPGKDDHTNYQDDEDYDNITLETFDLALRKQIVSIYNTYNKQKNEYNNRYAKLDESKDNTIYDYYDVDSNIPTVVENDEVTYSIRVYNEGKMEGTATWVTDRLPSGLEYLPDDEVNKEYGWKAFKLSTADVKDAVKIGEKYYEEVDFDSNEIYMYATDYLKDTTIEAYTGEGEATYGEVFMTTRVKAKSEVAEGTEYKLRNIAEIGDDTADDIDSTPGDESNWKDQDDVDVEDLKLVEFDLALRKWVTQAIVIDSSGQTITETGHQPYDDPEQVVKVELHRKKINEVTVKFRYSIRIVNEGDIAGYAKEITDYVPEGLKFVAEDNPGWTDEGNNVISTRLLENTLLQPGEFADVEVLLTWINNENNMGIKTNTAEISEDYNEHGVPDRDSTPDNKKWGEDDIDDAPVMLSISTGQMRIYFTLGFAILVTIAGGIILIRKYVL